MDNLHQEIKPPETLTDLPMNPDKNTDPSTNKKIFASNKKTQILLLVLSCALLIVVIVLGLAFWFGNRNSTNDTIKTPSTTDTKTETGVGTVTIQNKILTKGRQQGSNKQDWYWISADGSSKELINFDLQIDPGSQLIESVEASPKRTKLLITAVDINLYEKMNKFITDYLTGTPSPDKDTDLEDRQQYFYITSPDGKIINQINRNRITDQIGEFKYINFTSGWMTDEKIFFEAKNSSFIEPEPPIQRVILGSYDLNTEEVEILADKQARSLYGGFFDENKMLLLYVSNYGFLDSFSVLKNLNSNEEHTIDTNGFLFTAGKYWVGFPTAGEFFEANLSDMRTLAIRPIDNLQFQTGTVTLPDPRRYFSYEYQSLSWSKDYSLFAVTTEYDRSGYGIEYQEPQLYVYDKSGNTKCMWTLNDSVITSGSVYPEKYSEKIFSPDNRYLLLVSKPITDYYGTVYWRIFDLTDCSLNTPKKKMDEQLTPIAWF